MKKIIVIDTRKSAMGISALQHASLDGSIVIAALDYHSISQLIKSILDSRPDILIFAWRRILLDLIYLPFARKELEATRAHTRIFFVVADHLGLNQKFQEQEKALFDFADGYFTTSKILENEYARIYPSNPPIGIYRDIPNLKALLEVRSEQIFRNPKKIVWVGNSKWGIHYGYRDHKGLETLIKPLMLKLQRSNPEIVFQVIDSASGIRNNIEVLRVIRSSKILLMASVSEGTGIPLLEALALGTLPISNNVGVADELFSNTLLNNIVNRDIDSYYEMILERIDEKIDEDFLVRRFEEYLSSCNFDVGERIRVDGKRILPFTNFRRELLIRFRWEIRFVRNILKNNRR